MTERTYYDTTAAYVLPNDALECQRLEYQSKALSAMMNGQVTHSPLVNPGKLLDVGCGIGSVTQYLAMQHRDSKVIGVDLSPVPKLSTNAIFLQGEFSDLAKNHPLIRDGAFDYIFSRLLVYGITDWPCYIRQAFSLLDPGGWLELQEGELLFCDENKTLLPENRFAWIQHQRDALSRRGLDTKCAAKLAGWMHEAGFVDISIKEFRWVIGRWKGHSETDSIGEYSVNVLAPMFIEMYKELVTSRTAEELEIDAKEIQEAYSWAENGKHTTLKVVYGRRPGMP